MQKSPLLTKQQKSQIRKLFKEGKKRAEIATELGVTYAQVCYCLPKSRKSSKRSVEPTDDISIRPNYAVLEADYANLSARYRKALAILIEHDLIDVQF